MVWKYILLTTQIPKSRKKFQQTNITLHHTKYALTFSSRIFVDKMFPEITRLWSIWGSYCYIWNENCLIKLWYEFCINNCKKHQILIEIIKLSDYLDQTKKNKDQNETNQRSYMNLFTCSRRVNKLNSKAEVSNCLYHLLDYDLHY